MQLRLIQSELLTENSQIKQVYLQTYVAANGCQLDYQAGDWLLMHAINPEVLVAEILNQLGLQGDETVQLRRIGEVSAEQALSQYLEITQLNPAILNKMQRQLQIGEWDGRQAMMDYAYGRDIVDLLNAFPQMAVLGADFLSWLSPLAPRYYSIASADNKQVKILFKALNYHYAGRDKSGVASNYLAQLPIDAVVEGELKTNPLFKLPENPQTPIIMVGAGTGLAPFLGFIAERQRQQAGENILFFGETEKANACLCCEQLQAAQAKGDLQLFMEFSRDQAEKRYVQDAMREQKALMWQKWQDGAVLYVCGSQKTLAPAVERLWQQWLAEEQQLSKQEAAQLWQGLRKERRIQFDVY
jgi:sulfite reductase (NADPH) flavoprotein alpha-component